MRLICLGLKKIHNEELIHKDLHPGNILNYKTITYISDFGFCIPANENLSNSTRKNVYGVMPYMAPEILHGKPYTVASDIYSLGVIINEMITVIPPFNNQPHDHYLALDICRGLRPTIRENTLKFLKELIEKCWDANPENRPTSEEIIDILYDHKNKWQIEELEKLSYKFNESLLAKQLRETHPQAIYTSRLLNLPNLPDPINCSNQQEFESSRKNIVQIQTEEVNILRSDDCIECAITEPQ